jgi:molybdopterin-containing oxidoreductase family membrane subunit
MLDNAFRGSRKFWMLIGFWLIVILAGFAAYSQQLTRGLTVTGMSRDVSWGLYISQFTFLVGVAASAVMVVLPYYLHNFKKFGRMVILGEFLAVSSVIMCALFIFVDLGQPRRVSNVFLHPTPNSPMFWDSVVLMGYMVINFVIGVVTFDAERKGAPPRKWVKPLIYISIPWAVSIHTVTAFLYSGLAARPFWLTAILAPRFLASAFASGPSLLIILALIMRKYTKFDPGKEAIRKLAVIVTYAMVINVFFVLVELFTALYSHMPHHLHSFEYLFVGLDGKTALVPWMWTSAIINVTAVVLLIFPRIRAKESMLAVICVGIIIAIWIEKGMGLVVTGFIPNPLGQITEYTPTGLEVLVAVGVYGIGFLVLSLLYKIVVAVRERTEQNIRP